MLRWTLDWRRKGQSCHEKRIPGGKGGKDGGRTHGRRAVAIKEAKTSRKVAREKPEHVGRVARQDILLRGVEREKLVAVCEDDSENVEGATDNEEDL